MLKNLLKDSFTLLRRPTLKTFGAIRGKDWRLGILYTAMGTVVTILLTMLSNTIQAPRRAVIGAQLAQRIGPNQLTAVLNNLQNPLVVLAIGLAGFFIVLLLRIVLPYALGRAFGGAKSFGSFAYRSSLFITPVSVIDSLLALILAGVAGGFFLFLSLCLDAFRFYLVYLNVRATLKLSALKSAFVVLIPVLLAVLIFCGVLIYFSAAALRK